jgi:hypothetical protein
MASSSFTSYPNAQPTPAIRVIPVWINLGLTVENFDYPGFDGDEARLSDSCPFFFSNIASDVFVAERLAK